MRRMEPVTHMPMESILRRDKEFYNDEEVARELAISRERLYQLLDEHVFQRGELRPAPIHFRVQDIVMIGEWMRQDAERKVLRMPAAAAAKRT